MDVTGVSHWDGDPDTAPIRLVPVTLPGASVRKRSGSGLPLAACAMHPDVRRTCAPKKRPRGAAVSSLAIDFRGKPNSTDICTDETEKREREVVASLHITSAVRSPRRPESNQVPCISLKSSTRLAIRASSIWSITCLARWVAARMSRVRIRSLTRPILLGAIDRLRKPRPSSRAV
jgi:hypothetical protein